MLRICLATAVLFLSTGLADAAVKTRTIKYKDGDLECIGTLAWDDAKTSKRPGVLIVHEWWGLDDYARSRAEQLAALGYVAFACDMYGEGKTVNHPNDAREMATKVRSDIGAWRKRATTALEVLKTQPECDNSKLAAIGYCFGGSTALQLAFGGADLKAVVSFHGALPTPTADEVKQIKPRILVCHGANDTFIPEAAIKGFRGALDAGGAKYEFISYPDTVHSFTVPGADKHNIPGIKYNKAADEASWKSMRDLFAETLK